MTRGRARRYLLTKSDESYYPQVVADAGYDVWDWSTLNSGTLFQDSAKTTPASANGDVIGCWTDGVNGVDATQVTTANKPGLATASLNGLPTLSFDGGDLLATGNISISTFAVWVVFRNNAIGNYLPYEHSVDSNTNDGMVLNTNGGGATNTIRVRRSANSDIYTLTNNWGNDNTWRIVRHAHNGTSATHTLTLDNVLQSMTNLTANDLGTGTATAPFFIGARSGVVSAIIGNIAHLCIVSPYPTDAAIITNMESYINNQWNGVY